MPVNMPWYHVGIDFVGPLTTSDSGNHYILTLSDYCSKWVEAVPLPTKHASGVAHALFKVNIIFMIMFGRKATLPIDLVMAKQDSEGKLQNCLETGGELSASEVENLASHWQGIIEEAKQNIKQAQEKQEVYDLKHAHPDAFKVGCQVLKKDFRRKKQANGKLNMRYLGPDAITESLGKGLYALELVADPTQVVSRVHGAHLKPYHLPPSTDHSDTTTAASSASDVSLEQPSTEPSVPSWYTLPSVKTAFHHCHHH